MTPCVPLTSDPANPAKALPAPPVNYGLQKGNTTQYPVPKREPRVPRFEPRRGSQGYLQVLGYFQSHLCATSKEAARALKLSSSTVQRYVKLIREDWGKPAPFILDPEAIEMRLRSLERMASTMVPAT